MDPALAIGAAVGLLLLLVVGVSVRRAALVRGEEEHSSPDDPSLEGEDTELRPSEAETEVEAPSREASAFERFKAGLARTRQGLGSLFSRTQPVDAALFESLEEALIRADVGVRTAADLVEELRATGHEDPEALRGALRELLTARLQRFDPALNPAPSSGPHVILVVGVNGSGKTTSIGKLAHRFRSQGRSVLLAAGDTYRAGAIEQLGVWAQRADADFISKPEGSDPASVCYDALEAAKGGRAEVVLLDTAGRLQSMKPLMEELAKVTRVVGKALPGAPHEVLLVLDGTMGQNAISQARSFKEVTGVTGVILTKLDGTAKGGVVVAIAEELGLPVKFIGMDDLRPFDAEAFAQALV